MNKEIICTVCPRGCHITVCGTESAVESLDGYGCKRGIDYATNEYIRPVRILTTTVKMNGIEGDLLPVRSDKPLPKESLFDCMAVIRGVSATLPIQVGDVIIPDICGTGINIVATKTVK